MLPLQPADHNRTILKSRGTYVFWLIVATV